MESSAEIEKLRAQIERAKSERDSWKGRSGTHYEMACHLVAALEMKLRSLLAMGEPGDE